MKAYEVLKRYADGRRDFSGENLRGQSFKGKNLSGANFSEADIRGANFTNAMLTDANFSGANAGLQRRWAMGLVIASWIFSGLSGVLSIFLGYFVESIFDSSISRDISGWEALIVIAIFFIVTIRKGLVAGLGTLAVAVAVAVAVVGAVSGAVAGARAEEVAVAVAGAVAVAVTFAVAGAVAVAVTFAVAFAVTATSVAATSVAFAVAVAATSVAVAFAVTFAATATSVAATSVAVAGAVVLLSAYISWRALKGDERDAWIRTFAIAFAAIGGTSFRNADLTDADFTSATLKSTDFRKATLTCTRWHQAKKLDRIRPGTTYLQFPQVRQLLITGQAQSQNFDRQNLRGVNLQGANLADASFIGADLSSANLQDADLSRAKLVQTQLDETDLTGATLTGAYIEDWGITSHTKLDGVRCEYVFMRVPTKEDPNPRRKPDNWKETFKDGDFADFIKPIVDTLDLYHNQDVDPRAIAISFKQLAENHPDAELEIVAMEKRGQGNFLLRAKTAPEADHSALNAEYSKNYNRLKSLPKDELISLITQQSGQIQSLEIAINTVTGGLTKVAETPKYNIQGSKVYGFAPETTGSSLVSGETVQDNEIVGTQHNHAPEQRQTLAEAASEIQQLLKQLEQSNPTATEVEQKAFLTAAIPPTKKQRFANALQEGGKELFKELMDNIYVNVAVAAIEGWQSGE